MYTAKYTVRNTRTPCGRRGQSTSLKAKFRFGDEVPKTQIEEVLRRLNFNGSGGDSLNVYDYLTDKGFTFDREYFFSLLGYGCFFTKGKNNREWGSDLQDPGWTRVCLDISTDEEVQIPLEDMLDLEGLNRFILTGKMGSEGEGE